MYRSSKIHHVLKRYDFFMSEHNDVLLIEDDEPTNCMKAMSDNESKRWLQARKSEMDSCMITKYGSWLINLKG